MLVLPEAKRPHACAECTWVTQPTQKNVSPCCESTHCQTSLRVIMLSVHCACLHPGSRAGRDGQLSAWATANLWLQLWLVEGVECQHITMLIIHVIGSKYSRLNAPIWSQNHYLSLGLLIDGVFYDCNHTLMCINVFKFVFRAPYEFCSESPLVVSP